MEAPTHVPRAVATPMAIPMSMSSAASVPMAVLGTRPHAHLEPPGASPRATASGSSTPAPALDMTGDDRVALWQQRLLEAESGMTTFLLEHHADLRLLDWLHTQAEIFADFPTPDDRDPTAWQRVFFRAQALIERFIVSRWGEAELVDWARANASVFGKVEPEPTGRPADVVHRLARQADLYSSRYAVDTDEPMQATLIISHCGIWDYREQARARGVPLTLASPCSFCTTALSANIRAKGYEPAFRLLHDDPSVPSAGVAVPAPGGQPAVVAGSVAGPGQVDRGCVWTATGTTGATGATGATGTTGTTDIVHRAEIRP